MELIVIGHGKGVCRCVHCVHSVYESSSAAGLQGLDLKEKELTAGFDRANRHHLPLLFVLTEATDICYHIDPTMSTLLIFLISTL